MNDKYTHAGHSPVCFTQEDACQKAEIEALRAQMSETREALKAEQKGKAMTGKALETISLLTNLDTSDRLLVLEFLFKHYPHQWDYATMPSSLRRFYDPSTIRPAGPHD